MDEVLGHPDADLHGGPIPKSGSTNHPEVVLIVHTAADTRMQVIQASDPSLEALRFLAEHDIAIGT